MMDIKLICGNLIIFLKHVKIYFFQVGSLFISSENLLFNLLLSSAIVSKCASGHV